MMNSCKVKKGQYNPWGLNSLFSTLEEGDFCYLSSTISCVYHFIEITDIFEHQQHGLIVAKKYFLLLMYNNKLLFSFPSTHTHVSSPLTFSSLSLSTSFPFFCEIKKQIILYGIVDCTKPK